MPIEVEQKYRVANPQALLESIIALGVQAKKTVTQVDTYYAHPARDFATTDEALRIRQVGKENVITYKGPKLDATTKTRREIELPLPAGHQSAADYEELLAALSFTRVAQVSKTRQTFSLERDNHNIELAVDEVTEVGNFAELEIVITDGTQIQPAQAAIQSVASELQLTDTERRSYLELLLETLGQ